MDKVCKLSKKELVLLDTALTDFIQSRNHFYRELEPYYNLRNKVQESIKKQEV